MTQKKRSPSCRRPLFIFPRHSKLYILPLLMRKVVRIWDAASGEQRETMGESWRVVGPMSFSHDGALLALPCRDKTILVWDLGSGQHRRTLSGPGEYRDVRIASDGGSVYATAKDKTYGWSLQDDSDPQTAAGYVLSPQNTWSAASGTRSTGSPPSLEILHIAFSPVRSDAKAMAA